MLHYISAAAGSSGQPNTTTCSTGYTFTPDGKSFVNTSGNTINCGTCTLNTCDTAGLIGGIPETTASCSDGTKFQPTGISFVDTSGEKVTCGYCVKQQPIGYSSTTAWVFCTQDGSSNGYCFKDGYGFGEWNTNATVYNAGGFGYYKCTYNVPSGSTVKVMTDYACTGASTSGTQCINGKMLGHAMSNGYSQQQVTSCRLGNTCYFYKNNTLLGTDSMHGGYHKEGFESGLYGFYCEYNVQ